MSVACTFPGKYGDILWSLPTARAIAALYGQSVDFWVMPAFESICPLLEQQPYIRNAYGLPTWHYVDDACGARPLEHPPLPGYSHVFDLGYKSWPDRPLVQFIAWQAGIDTSGDPLPFIQAPDNDPLGVAEPYIAVAFNFPQKVEIFWKPLAEEIEKRTGKAPRAIFTPNLPWVPAATMIKGANLFIGDRASNYVLAHALGKPILTYETDLGRHNPIFSCPHGKEKLISPQGSHLEPPTNLHEFVDAALELMNAT